MNIYVGGVNGVGKSTILRRAAAIDPNFEIIHYSAAVMQLLGLQPGDYEAFHQLAMTKCNQATAELMNDLVRRQTSKVRLIDGHFLAIREGQINQLAGDWVGGLDAVVLITASPAVSWQRLQLGERWQDRRIFAPGTSAAEARNQLDNYIQATQAEFDRWTNQYQLDHLIIEHNSDDADRDAKLLVNFVSTIQA